jgi:hypothetical protein
MKNKYPKLLNHSHHNAFNDYESLGKKTRLVADIASTHVR